MKRFAVPAMAGAIVLLAGVAFAEGSGGDAAHGKQVFDTKGCFTCHGYVGQGGPGIRLAPNPLPLEVIATYIRNPSGEMPPFTSKEISDNDIRDIHAYLATIKPPPKLADIPLLN